MSNTDKLSMSRFIFQYLLPLFITALILVLLSYVSDVRAANTGDGTDLGESYAAVIEVPQADFSVFCD